MSNDTKLPWYQRTYRWGQTNLAELDPVRYDADWWRAQWKRTHVQGVIINAGGIVAYYPSRYPLQHRALYLGERDLYGEIVAAARADGLSVLARMDSNRADEHFYMEHPGWFAIDAEGHPYRAGELYVSCVNSPYYREYLPGVLREIIERSHPDGLTDNSWSGLERNRICYCDYCVRKFRAATGMALPQSHDWDSDVYKQWIQWNYACRVEVWELNNRTTQEVGGHDCLWIGMNSGNIVTQSERFRDYKALCERTEIIMLDSQYRTSTAGFQSNSDMGKLIHGLLGWEKQIPESTALYGAGQPTFRLASKPEPEVRMWALEGFAGGIHPWWHHISAYHEDRRQYRTAEPFFTWHQANEQFLVNRTPIANVGVVWTQRNVDFYGRDAAEERVAQSYRGVINALIRARIPYVPVHVDHIARDSDQLDVLILPNIGAMSDEQCAQVRHFVAQGKGLIASSESSCYDEWGNPRSDFALADLFGVHATNAHHGSLGESDPSWETWSRHTYLRLVPELRAQIDGPQIGTEPPITAERHPVLAGFEETDILPFGGRIEVVDAVPTAQVLASFVPSFPIYPPETSWMRYPTSTLPALVLNTPYTGCRVAYLPADIDRCFGRDNLPDHATLLANLVRWALAEHDVLRVDGPGLIDCQLYRQADRLILHLVNLTNVGTWRAPLHELISVGPLHVRLRLQEGVAAHAARLLVADSAVPISLNDGWLTFAVPTVTDHEVVVVS
jgi:hypothetical protein